MRITIQWKNLSSITATLIFLVYLYLFEQPAFADNTDPSLVCSASHVVVTPDDHVTLSVFSQQYGANHPPQAYTWLATAGVIKNTFPTSHWSLAGQPPGKYTATIRIEDATKKVNQCDVTVFIEEKASQKKLNRNGTSRETGSDLLSSNQMESSKYGLYTYLLLSAPPNAQNREKYIMLIRAFLNMAPEINRLEKYIPPSQLNVAYLPVTKRPTKKLTGKMLEAFVLKNYDYARSRAILRLIPGTHRDGPYILSSSSFVSGLAQLEKPYIEEDLTLFPTDMVEPVFKEYLIQAANEAFYEKRSLARLALNMRAIVHVLANAKPKIESELNNWLKLVE